VNRPFREFWSGTITFGLVSVPVQLVPAQRHGGVALREIGADGTPLRRRFFCPEHGKIVDPSEIVRGYKFEAHQYVVVTEQELEDLEPKKSREIDLRLFVPVDEISPLFFERSYYLGQDGDSSKAYRLLASVLERSGRAGIATFVMRDREYLIAILGEKGILRGETLRFADEVRRPQDIGLDPEGQSDQELTARFSRLIEAQANARLDPRELKDEYAEDLSALAARKEKRGTDVVAAPERAEAADEDEPAGEDLLETIRRSLGKHGGTGVRDRPRSPGHKRTKARAPKSARQRKR
jgi:DNA end-binding protein Ku